jgi:hypothetical protein
MSVVIGMGALLLLAVIVGILSGGFSHWMFKAGVTLIVLIAFFTFVAFAFIDTALM